MHGTLQQVLTTGGGGRQFLIDLNSIILVVLALALSLATYTLVKKKKPFKKMVPHLQEMESDHTHEELERALFINERLNKEVEDLRAVNKEASIQLKHLGELERIEQTLRKSNLALAKKCDDLKSEKEELTLKLNSLAMLPKAKKSIKPKKKTKK